MRYVAIALATATVLAGCGSAAAPSSPSTSSTTAALASRPAHRARAVAPRITPRDVLAAFRSAGLEVGRTTRMQPSDYGPAPLVAKQGVHFLIASLGSGAGGRVFTFTNTRDLRTLRHYYSALGRASAVLFSWTLTNAKRLVLVQINGDLPARKAARYRSVVERL